MTEISRELIIFFKKIISDINSGIVKNDNLEIVIKDLKNKLGTVKNFGKERDSKEELIKRSIILN